MRGLTKDDYGYESLIDSMGYEIVLQVDDNDYQGDSRTLLRDGERWGFLSFGWGSCSGCDALQAVEGDLDEMTKLRDSLAADVHWEPDRSEMHRYLAEKDWGLEFFGHRQETDEFVRRALGITGVTPGEVT